jgi:hypothetical protein
MNRETTIAKKLEAGEMRQTNVRMPEDLWRRAKQACLDHDTNLTALFNEGLELRLEQLRARKPESVKRKASSARPTGETAP